LVCEGNQLTRANSLTFIDDKSNEKQTFSLRGQTALADPTIRHNIKDKTFSLQEIKKCSGLGEEETAG